MAKRTEAPPTWKQRKAGIKKKWTTPFQKFEWACEWISYKMSQWAFIELLEYGGKLAVVVTAFVYVFSANERKQAADDTRKSKHYIAWQTLNLAAGKPGSSGRAEALESLNADGISLHSIDLSGAAFNETLNLPRARMSNAKFTGVRMVNPNFYRAILGDASFEAAVIMGGDFRFAGLADATYTNAEFWGTDFSHAFCWSTKLGGAKFNGCNFVGSTNLFFQINECNFIGCNFANADFTLSLNTNTQEIAGGYGPARAGMFHGCNFYGVHDIYFTGFVNWATNEGGAVSIPITNYSEWKVFLATNDILNGWERLELCRRGIINTTLRTNIVKKP